MHGHALQPTNSVRETSYEVNRAMGVSKNVKQIFYQGSMENSKTPKYYFLATSMNQMLLNSK